MRSIIIAELVAAGLFCGCATSRLETRITELEKELKAARAATPMPMDNTMEPAELPDLPSPAFAATNFPTGWPRPASVHVNTVPTVPNLRQHTVHNFTTGLGVAVQEGGVFLPVDSGVTMNVDPDGTGKYMLISVVPPGGAPDFTVALHGPPINRLLSFVCIEMQENGTGRVVGRHASRVPYGAGGYNTRDSYVTNWNCVGK